MDDPTFSEGELLVGAQKIAQFLYGSSETRYVRRVYHQARKGTLPVAKDGKDLIAMKSCLAEHYAKLHGRGWHNGRAA